MHQTSGTCVVVWCGVVWCGVVWCGDGVTRTPDDCPDTTEVSTCLRGFIEPAWSVATVV